MNETYQGLLEIDRIIHEPARLLLVTILSAVEEADFLYLLTATGLTKGNLSSHLTRLEQAGYLEQEKALSAKCRARFVGSLRQVRRRWQRIGSRWGR